MRSSIAITLLAAAVLVACGRNPGGGSGELPDLPLYPGAEWVSTASGEGRDPTAYYRVPDTEAADVLDWYAVEMPRAGWVASTDPNEPFVIYHTEAGCYGFVAAYANDDGSVELQLSRQDPSVPCVPYVTAEAGTE